MPSTLPLFPIDDEWPYPEVGACLEPVVDDVIDLDALELRCDPHAYSDLTELERDPSRPTATGSTVPCAR